MKKIKNIDKLTDIKSVVFYDSDGSLIKTLHSGKSNKVLLDNHSQYNFSYLFEKDKYNGNFIVNDLDIYSKNLLGFGEEGITKIEKVLFPTLISEQNDDTNDYDYFGYLLIDNSKFFLLDILPSTKYIILSNLFLNTVSTSIEIDKDKDIINSEYCYIVLKSSSKFRRILSIYLSSNSDPKINLMYQLFLNDNKNPFRNAHKIYLRNDDYYKESTDIDIISENKYSPEKIYNLDKSSGTILSNSIKNEELLIFNRKKNISDNLVNQFDKHVRYNKNDQVIIKNHKNEDEVWISLVDNNLGNIPNYSSLWSKETTLNNIRLNRLYLSLGCNNTERVGKVYSNFAKLNKSGYIILNDENLIFEITLEDGFKLSEEGCLILDNEKLEDEDFTIENNPSNINNKSITISTSNLIDKYTLTCQVIPKMYKLSISVDDNDLGFNLYEGDIILKESTEGGYNVFNQDTIKIVPNNGKILDSIQLNSGNCIINNNFVTILPQANENSVINLVLNIINKLCNIFIDNDIRIISDCDKSFSKPQEEVIIIRFYTDEENKELYVEDLNTYAYNSREDKITREGRDDIINVSNNEFTISYYINNDISNNTKEKHYRINNINYQIDEINIEDFMLARYRIDSNLIVTIDFRNEKIIKINDDTVNQDLVIGVDGSITITVDDMNYVFNIDNEANLSTTIDDVEVVIIPETIFTIDDIIYTIDWNNNKINNTINIEEGNYFYLNNIKYYINNYWPKYYIYTIANTIETESLGNSTYKFELNAGITEKTSDGIYNYIVKIDKDETVIKLKVKE